jgi:type IV pilus assembly protein PilY1
MQRRLMLALASAGGLLFPEDVRAQSGNVQRPMPDVLLLVDTSGSMERMPDGSLPGENTYGPVPSACVPGVESQPNRWGIILQALTGNMQPFYSCAKLDRTSAAFQNEYKIAGVLPYDTRANYFLPYHRPLTGIRSGSIDTVCAIGPHRLPGAAPDYGVGPAALGYSTPAGQGGDVRDFPEDALVTAKLAHMQLRYEANAPLDDPLNTNACIFDQARDGQLDAARDYIRFALMTFDNDVDPGIGVNNGVWPPQGAIQAAPDPFLGQWSYHRSPGHPNGAGAASGLPMNCIGPSLPFEVGARHWGAPPWEGRMVPFPPPDATLFDIQETNERIQRVLLATRPYGATPIDAMMDDARDYLWYNPIGPSASDRYVNANCRDRYIILLTDGAPNLNLRPSCEGPGGVCPFRDTAADIANKMYNDTEGKGKVTTFVIGFSVNGESGIGGDGFPEDITSQGKNNCKAWYLAAGNTPQGMADACNLHQPAPGTTAAACCVLNEIAFNGSGGTTGPFFAESQADVVLSFGQILAAVTKTVATRTVPTYTPTAYIPAGATPPAATTADFLASFVPNAQKPWSGELARTRWVCEAPNPMDRKVPTKQNLDTTLGDSMAVNLVTQGSENRLFLTFIPDAFGVGPGVNPPTNQVIDAAGTVRPFYSELTPTPSDDGAPKQTGLEEGARGWSDLQNTTNIRLALDIDKKTCKRGRAVDPLLGTREIPALDRDDGEDCTKVVLGFVTAYAGDLSYTGTGRAGNTVVYNFNVRCKDTNTTPTTGKCSVSATTCNISDPSSCPTGETCVPDCAPLGAIFRANPVVVGPPDALLREQGYRDFQSRYAKRKPVIYAATADGILHAFKATEQAPGAHHELWSFIPPAVLPRLASNYPAGNQILLDGTPVVKDTVWDRATTEPNFDSGTKWHTTLVAGLGEGGGYYALNVTDSDCGQRDSNVHAGECANQTGSTGYDKPANGNLDQAGRAQNPKRGPHFLWQLTDVPQSANLANETAKVTRRGRDGKNYVALFGRRTGTPAITTLQLKIDGVDHQVGVAILPGGIDGPPIKGPPCPRILSSTEDATDPAFGPRNEVRRWAPGTDPNCSEAVPGRSVTIVRLDTGQIIRHFGRSQDVPEAIRNAPGVFQSAPFMSPMTGTPVVYPQTTGAVGQKIFIGDADGNLWRIDVSSTDPAQWKVQLFADLLSRYSAQESQPIQVTPVISLDPSGNLIVNAATGDQDSIVYKPGEKNFIWSIQETRPTGTADPPRAKVKWVEELNDGERVTGPMTVFDRTLYFATFSPKVPAAGQCDDGGTGKVWGLHYYEPDPTNGGGKPMWCANVDASSGACLSASLVKNENITSGHIISGVTLRANQACADITQNTDEWNSTAFSAFTPSQFYLSFGVGQATGNVNAPPSATLQRRQRPLPRMSTRIDAWALVID